MALTLSLSRLRMTTAKYFGKYNVASGTVTQVTAGAGITLTPNPIVATGTVAITAPVTVPLGGTGQTTFGVGYVLFGDAANSVKTDSELFWNNTLKYLGVGGSPSYPLTVSDTVGTTGVDNYSGYFSLTKNAAEPVTNSVGLYGGVTLNLAGGATVANFGGIASRVRVINAGTGTQGTNFAAVASVEDTATWNSRIGYYVTDATVAVGAALTDQYGIYIPSLTAASGNNYAIYTAGATPSFFNGKLSTAADLRVDGNAGFGVVSPLYRIHSEKTSGATGAIEYANVFKIAATAADANDRRVIYAAGNANHAAGTVASMTNVYTYGIVSGAGGTITNYRNYIADVNVTAGTITNRYGFMVIDATVAGTLNNQYGVYVNQLTSGGTLNWAVYTAGTTPSYFGGATTFLTSVGVGHSSTPTRQIDLSGTQRFRGIAAPAVSEANSATMYFDSAANTLKASLNGSPYVNVIGSAGLTGSGDVTTSLPYWTTPTNLSYLHWIGVDQAFHRLGINTAAPAQELDVTGTLNITGEYQTNYVQTLGLDTTNHVLRVGQETPNYYGDNSIGVGHDALAAVTANAGDGDNCAAVGAGALSAVTTGTGNTALGKDAGNTLTTGSNNLLLGFDADCTAGNLSNATAIGYQASVAQSDSLILGNTNVNVGIRTSTPKATLDVAGSFRVLQQTQTLVNGLNSDITPASDAVTVLRIEGPTGVFSIGGFAMTQSAGQFLYIHNSAAFQMTIVNEDLSSTAANRIKTLTGGNVVLRAGTSAATFIYDDADDRWVLVSYN